MGGGAYRGSNLPLTERETEAWCPEHPRAGGEAGAKPVHVLSLALMGKTRHLEPGPQSLISTFRGTRGRAFLRASYRNSAVHNYSHI